VSISAREDEIRILLTQSLKLSKLEFEDQSHLHAGHMPIPKHGGSHVALVVVSEDFEGLSRVDRSRKVYEVLGELLEKRGLHALSMKLLSPAEYQQKKESSDA
jgi:BolA family transcriptional regulator, general stress-responsive regulator